MGRTIVKIATAILFVQLLAIPAVQASPRVYVRVAPPPVVVEQRPPAPRGHYVWRPGYHRWSGSDYVWVRGEWERPPYRHAHWVRGRWVHERRGYYWVPGHWVRR
jgi:WXXGXW repeat (2 copies)